MKTNDIKITQRAEYYYTAIDLFQTVHQNRSVLGVLGCKADAQKVLRVVVFFFLMLAPAFFASWRRLCHCRIAQVLPAPACPPLHGDHGFYSPVCIGILTRQKYIDEDFSLSG